MKAIAILSIMITALSSQTMGSPCPIPIPAIVQNEQPDNRILIIGENHESLEQRAYTRSILPQLRNQGYNTLLVEAPNHLVQNKRALIENLRSAPGVTRQPDASIQSYIQLLNTAESLGFKLYGYDIDVGWPWKTDESPPLASFFRRFVIKRNEIISKNVSSYFSEHPNTKAVMLIGRLHLGIRNDPTMQAVHDALGKKANYDLSSSIQQIARVPVFSVALSGGRPGRGTPHPFALQAIKQDAADKWRFALTRGKHNADLFLHIPQGSPSQLASISN